MINILKVTTAIVLLIISLPGVGQNEGMQFPNLASAASHTPPSQKISPNTGDIEPGNSFGNVFNLNSGWLLDPVIDCRNYSSINAAVNAIGTSTKTLLVANPQILTGNLAIPANITLLLTNAGSISKASNYTLAINGPFFAGRYPVFVGFSAGDIIFDIAKEVYPEWWKANVTPGTTDMTTAIMAATSSMTSHYEVGKTVIFANTFYRITSTLAFNLANAANVHWYASAKASIFPDQPDGQWVMTIDFYTGGGLFQTFNMTNISFNDYRVRMTKKGVQTKMLRRSTWKNVEFKWLADATDFTLDSDLNTLDTCYWNTNVIGWHSSDGIANNNVFVNPLFMWNTGTSLDTTGTGGNLLIGGDFEPGNAAPVVIAYYLRMIGTRMESNKSGIYIRDLGGSDLEVDINSDSQNSALPAIQLEGSGSIIKPRVIMGTQGINCTTTSSRNRIYLERFWQTSNYPFVLDRGRGNTFFIGGSIQRGDGVISETGAADQLVPADPTTWIKTNCRVTASGNGLYKVTGIGAGTVSLAYQLTGVYSGIALAATLQALDVNGQPMFTINGIKMGTTTVAVYGDGASRSIGTTSTTVRLTNPIIGYTMHVGGTGAAFTIRDIRAAAGGVFPE